MKPLPEERLLRLIRGKGRAPAPGAAPPGVAVAGAPAPAAAARAGAPAGFAVPTAPGVRWVLAALGVVLLVEIGLLVYHALRPLPVPTIALLSTPAAPAEAPTPPAPPASLAEAVTRPLFTAPELGTDTGRSHSGLPSGTARVLSGRLTLLGIVAGTPPQAIIEDSETKRSYFVTEGQAVVDGAVLEEVLDNRVVLDLNGEKIELTL